MTPCTQCQTPFTIHPDEKAFLEKMAFVYGDQKIPLPEPAKCPNCRAQERIAFRNEQYMYQSQSSFSGKQIISLYDPENPWGKNYKVCLQEEWHSDSWDAMEYGQEFDFSRPFFEQFFEINDQVPKINLISVGNENSPYITSTAYSKNCHLINSSEYCEDCYYGKLLQHCKSSVDCSYLYNSELCYECFSVYDSYNCAYLSYSQNCSDCWFSENLSGCRNCFLCTDLKGKEYYFMNESLSKEEWTKRVEEFKGSHQNFQRAKEILADLRKKRTHKYTNIINSEGCTGDFIQNSQNCLDCYDVNDSQDCRYVQVGVQIKDVYDCSNVYIKPELNYQIMGTLEAYHAAFSLFIWHSQNVLYSDQIHNSKNIFGCTGVKRKEYCILNKQYTKEEYEELVPKIIEHMKKTGEWGQFFPVKYSPFGYNEALSHESFPLTEAEVKKRGWNWHQDDPSAVHQGVAPEIPDNISEVPDNITESILKCKSSDKLYKIMPQELKFYRQVGIPIPQRSPQQRHKDRMSLRLPRELYDRRCDSCGTEVKSPYSPEREERIYCEECYLKTVY